VTETPWLALILAIETRRTPVKITNESEQSAQRANHRSPVDFLPGIEMRSHLREFVDQRVDGAVELGVHRVGIGLVIDPRVQQRFDPTPGVFGVADMRFAA
jgi:hypothetical protein